MAHSCVPRRHRAPPKRAGAGTDVTDEAHWWRARIGSGALRRRVEAAGEGVRRHTEVTVSARGVLYVHSCPPAVRPHIEWAIAGVLGVPVRLDWLDQPVAPGCLRAQSGWRGPAGTEDRRAFRRRVSALNQLQCGTRRLVFMLNDDS